MKSEPTPAATKAAQEIEDWFDLNNGASDDQIPFLAEIIDRHAAPQWLPIESAPRDGSVFLATGWDCGVEKGTRHFAVAWWKNESGFFIEGPEDDSSVQNRLSYLTHWMPLPEPPTPGTTTPR